MLRTKTMAKEKIHHIFIIMTLASLSVIIPLAVYKSLIAVFLLYYVGMCIVVPFADLVLIKKLSLREAMSYLGFTKNNIKSSVLTGFMHGLLFLSFTIGGFFILKEMFLASKIADIIEQWGVSGEIKLLVFIVMVLFNGMVDNIFIVIIPAFTCSVEKAHIFHNIPTHKNRNLCKSKVK